MAKTPSPSVVPLRRRRCPLASAGRNSVTCGELFRRCERITAHDSSLMSARTTSESGSREGSVGVGAL